MHSRNDPAHLSTSLDNGSGGLRASLGLALVTLLGMGLLYTAAGAGIGQLLFPAQAAGSLLQRDGVVVGSAMLAQPFNDTRYFQPRPSAAKYDPMAAGGSNQARTNPDMRKRIDETVAAVATRDGIAAADVPGDLATQSGGGLDPDISVDGARVQVARVARARGMDAAVLQAFVDRHTTPAQFGFLGGPRVNVLQLNLALDARGAPPRRAQ